MSPARPLAGRHALVTGVREPDGRALAVGLAEAGADVSVTTLHDGELSEEVTANSILNECWAVGRDGRALTVDLADLYAVDRALERLEAEVGPVDLLVTPPVAEEIEAPAIGEGIAGALVEATPAFVLVRALGPRFAARGRGSIVVLTPAGDDTPAVAARGALTGLAEGLAAEWGPAGVAVAALEAAPGAALAVAVLDLLATEPGSD